MFEGPEDQSGQQPGLDNMHDAGSRNKLGMKSKAARVAGLGQGSGVVGCMSGKASPCGVETDGL